MACDIELSHSLTSIELATCGDCSHCLSSSLTGVFVSYDSTEALSRTRRSHQRMKRHQRPWAWKFENRRRSHRAFALRSVALLLSPFIQKCRQVALQERVAG